MLIKTLADKTFNFYPAGDSAESPSGHTEFGNLISTLLQTVIILAGLGALALIILGGLQFLTSGGDKAQAEAARDKITYAIIGLVVIVGAYAAIRVIETIFGISIVSGINWPGPSPTNWAGR